MQFASAARERDQPNDGMLVSETSYRPAAFVMAVQKTSPAARSLGRLDISELRARFRNALAGSDGVTGAHCIHEW